MRTAACSPDPRDDSPARHRRRLAGRWSADRWPADPRPEGAWSRAVADTASLVRFRLAGARRGSRDAPAALALVGAVSVVAALGPAFLPELALTRPDMLGLLPLACLGLLLVVTVSGAAAGGGRELVAREQAVAFPVSPVVDHLGALLLAPLSSAWLLQAWGLLGATSYAVGARAGLLPALVPVVVWLVAGTAVGQVLAWSVEWVRRGPRGVLAVRAVVTGLVVTLATVGGLGRLSPDPAAVLTRPVGLAVRAGASLSWGRWGWLCLGMVAVAALAVPLGAWLAGRVSGRPSLDQDRVETAVRPGRPHPVSDLQALLRVDRAGVWRSLSIRRGMVVLAVLPGALAVGGSFGWDTLTVFPGLVVSGGALLFGVNIWSLDGRGARWRESLPSRPRLALLSRAVVLAEILLLGTVATVLIASMRTGAPSPSQLAAVVCAGLVLTVQVVASALRWSVRRPYNVASSGARATPAPPLVMVGYSARLALSTTLTGLLFGALTLAPWAWSPAVACPFLAWSGLSLRRTVRAWEDPAVRSHVVTTVAG